MKFVYAGFLLWVFGCIDEFAEALLNITLPVKENSTPELPCMVEDPSGITVSWFNTKTGWLSSGTRVYEHHKRLSIHSPAPNEWNLRILRVDKSFEDTYRCETNTGELVTIVRLVIETPPKIDGVSSSKMYENFAENDDATLTCVATGIPAPTISWYRGKSYRAIGISGPVLKLRGITRYAVDEYICHAENKHGQDERWINVTVTFEPEVDVMESEVYAGIGEIAVMSCVIQGHPLYRSYWDRNGQVIDSNWKYEVIREPAGDGIPVEFLTLMFRKAAISVHDFGTYTCNAQGENSLIQGHVELKQREHLSEAEEMAHNYN